MSDYPEKISTEPVAFTESLVTSEAFIRFIEANRLSRETGYLTISVPFENIDPLAVLELNGDSNGTRFYWERPDHEMAIAAGNQVALIRSSGTDRFNSISGRVETLFSKAKNFSEINHSLAGAHLLGGFSFFDQRLSGTWSPFGNASFFLPEWLLVRDGQFSILNITRTWHPDETVDEISYWYHDWIKSFVERLRANIENSRILQSTVTSKKNMTRLESDDDRKRWNNNVEQARSWIKSGRFKKIVLARQLRLQTENRVSSTKLMHFLRSEYPSCYAFMYQLNGDATFLGSTPEKLLSLQSRYVKSEALAGSISRGNTATQDAINEKKLLESSKNREEHSYVLNAIRDKLLNLTDSLEHAPRPIIKKYANVQHLCTPVVASLTDTMNAVDIIEQLHPTPAVGGYPETDAVRHIQELEQFERGWYAGPVGWLNTNNRAEFSVAIRSGLIRQRHVQFFAGCGIVEDSDPDNEWEETQIKFLPMQKGLQYAME